MYTVLSRKRMCARVVVLCYCSVCVCVCGCVCVGGRCYVLRAASKEGKHGGTRDATVVSRLDHLILRPCKHILYVECFVVSRRA